MKKISYCFNIVASLLLSLGVAAEMETWRPQTHINLRGDNRQDNRDLSGTSGIVTSRGLALDGITFVNPQKRDIGETLTDETVKRLMDDPKTSTFESMSRFSCYHSLDGSEAFMDYIENEAKKKRLFGLELEKKLIGSSFEKHPMYAMRLTGNGVRDGEKGVLFLISGVHPREYPPPQLVSLWLKMLVDAYGKDPDLTAIVDHTVIHAVLQANPDGRKIAEKEEQPDQRKNTNPHKEIVGDCKPPFRRGVDLNRNWPVKNSVDTYPWGTPTEHSSAKVCAENFFGTKVSENEIISMINYTHDEVFRDGYDPKNGIFLDIHSYGRTIEWPWEKSSTLSRDNAEYEVLAKRFQDISAYWDIKSVYESSGTSTDWFYSDIGIMSLTLEVGGCWDKAFTIGSTTEFRSNCRGGERETDNFHLPCGDFVNVVKDVLPVLTYAARVSMLPRVLPNGPHVVNVAATIVDGVLIVDAKVMKMKSDLKEIRLSIDIHPYDYDVTSGPSFIMGLKMDFTKQTDDSYIGKFEESLEDLHLDPGDHFIYVEAVDVEYREGPVKTAAFSTFSKGKARPADVYFLIDITSSFTSDLETFKSIAPGLVDNLLKMNGATWFGLGSFQDYPKSPYGNPSDVAYKRNLPMTADKDALLLAISGLTAAGGSDGPESQLTALYQAATGEGQVVVLQGGSEYVIPRGLDAQFRPDAEKFILLWTDAPFHDSEIETGYPGPTFTKVVRALKGKGINATNGGVVVRRTLQADDISGIKVLGISRSAKGGYGMSDLERIVRETGALAGEEGLFCDEEKTVFIPPGEPIVCPRATGGATAILSAIEKAVEGSASVPLEAKCRDRVYVPVQAGCRASIVPEDINDGSTGNNITLSLNQSQFKGIGEYMVNLTATDAAKNNSTCQTILVVYDELLTPSDVDCGVPADKWHITPCQMSASTPLRFTPTVTRSSGCPVALAVTSENHGIICERCNDAGTVSNLACGSGVFSKGGSLVIKSTNGVGTFIRWSVTATNPADPDDSVKIQCGVCVDTPDKGCSDQNKNKRRTNEANGKGRTLGKKQSPKKKKAFQCPETPPQTGSFYDILTWPLHSLKDLYPDDGCPWHEV